MSLENEIRDRFMSDTETILQGHLDDLEGMFQFHEDGAIEILGDYREIAPKHRLLIYLIARRYQSEAQIAENAWLENDEAYQKFPDKGNSTVRGYFMSLREEGFARKSESGHELVVERLPEAIEQIESIVPTE